VHKIIDELLVAPPPLAAGVSNYIGKAIGADSLLNACNPQQSCWIKSECVIDNRWRVEPEACSSARTLCSPPWIIGRSDGRAAVGSSTRRCVPRMARDKSVFRASSRLTGRPSTGLPIAFVGALGRSPSGSKNCQDDLTHPGAVTNNARPSWSVEWLDRHVLDAFTTVAVHNSRTRFVYAGVGLQRDWTEGFVQLSVVVAQNHFDPPEAGHC
jgi:hypothetical protein